MEEALVDSVKNTPPIRGRKERNSSIELFRILAALLVLIVHLNGWMLGGLFDWDDISITPVHKYGQLAIISISCVCVNCFLLISGWFGLKLKYSAILKIWVTLVCIYIPFYAIEHIWHQHYSILGYINSAIAFSKESYFVQCYLMLMFFSPALNLLIEREKKRIALYTISIVTIEFVMEHVFQNKSLCINEGYSLFHFVTMYLVGRTLYQYKHEILKYPSYLWILVYILCAGLVGFMQLMGYNKAFAYSNPLVILESIMLFLPFVYYNFKSKTINALSESSFSVYIIQVTTPVCTTLFAVDQYAFKTLSYPTFLLLTILFSIVFFLVCFVYDYYRRRLTKPLLDRLEIRLSSIVNHII